jgi:mono/diheme cytochrome c family protein
MPAFGNAYSDEEIAAVANYVTARFGSKGSQLTAGRSAVEEANVRMIAGGCQ